MPIRTTDRNRGTAVELGYRLLDRSSPLRVWSRLQERLANQWLPEDQLEHLRWARLRDLLSFCQNNVAFYNRLWGQHGVDPSRFTSRHDLQHLPVVDRKMLSQALREGEFSHERSRQTRLVRTSGTTEGASFGLLISLAEYQNKYANHLRQFYTTGWRLGLRSGALHYAGHGQFKGRYTGELSRREPWFWLRDLVFNVAHRRTLMVPYHRNVIGDDEIVGQWYRVIRQHRPFLIDTFYINVLMLKDYIMRNRLEPPEIPVLFILNTLSEPAREEVQDFFRCKVFNRYSPHECEGIAVACGGRPGMHTAVDTYEIEILDEQRCLLTQGETGRIVVTDLENRTMPLVRYDIGDMGRLLQEPCPCGRSFPRMSDLEGRRRDAFFTEERSVTTSQMEKLFQDDRDIRFFQILRKASEWEMKVMPSDSVDHSEELLRAWSARLKQVLGDSEVVKVRFSDQLFFEPNGKFAFVKRVVDE